MAESNILTESPNSGAPQSRPGGGLLRFLVRKRTTFTWLVPLALLAAAWLWGRWSPAAYIAGFVLLVLGEIVRFWAAGYIHKDDVIATTGPYGLVRNPLYFGSLLLALGYTAMSGLGWVAWALVLGLFLLFHLAAILSEEQFLRGKFGPPYERYLSQVPRLVPMPRFGRRQASVSGAGSFSPQQALKNREHITAAVTLLTALLFAALHLVRSGRL